MTSTTGILFSQLATALPMLLVYLGGLILAALWWRRSPRAVGLAIAGLALLLLVTLASSIITAYLLANRPPSGIGTTIGIVSIASTFLRAVGTALVIAGVFADRARSSGFEVEPGTSQPPMAKLAPQMTPRS